VIAWLSAGIYRALLFVLKKLDKFRHGSFFDGKSFLAGVIDQWRIADCGLRILFVNQKIFAGPRKWSEPG
jgi:hypothetical protein